MRKLDPCHVVVDEPVQGSDIPVELKYYEAQQNDESNCLSRGLGKDSAELATCRKYQPNHFDSLRMK